MAVQDLKSTLNLPKTAFSMKADLPRREPEMMAWWDQIDLYGKLREARRGSPAYLLHDGPPYANGRIHLGHALNKILKDFIVRSRTMMGFDSPYIPGWDCHGLPIELQVERDLGSKKREMSPLDLRKECRAYAEKFVALQAEDFRRLLILGEWQRPYLTIDASYEAAVVEELAGFHRQGLVYKGKKPVHWCTSCRTALAEAEVEYEDHESPSITVRFPVDLGPARPDLSGMKASVPIWTTTPWTLPSNLAIALRPGARYVLLRGGGEIFVVAEALASSFVKTARLTSPETLGTLPAESLEGLKARHPFIDRDSPLVLSDHVALDTGTGAVHTAPGHGLEDFAVGVKYGLPAYTPVDEAGRFTAEVPEFQGRKVFEANPLIVELLKERGALIDAGTIRHPYPHCWRCKNPVIFRATFQWFISMDRGDLRARGVEAAHAVRWIPAHGEERMVQMIERRPDWCISRQRVWGVPIPGLKCADCGASHLDADVLSRVAEIFRTEGSNAWWSKPIEAFVGSGHICPSCGGRRHEKEYDILDVWFEAGVSHAAVLGRRKDLPWPSSLYIEGTDQYRGWFHSSLLTAAANHGGPPYSEVICHGFTLDGEGRKMSKSLGNVISPQDVITKMGAEVLRLWVSMVDYLDDVRLSDEILDRNAEAYRKIRNTFRYFLGNLHDFDPARDAVPPADLPEMDLWALDQVNAIIARAREGYEGFEFHTVHHALHNFCAVEMSSLYLDVVKDRLYVESADSPARRAAQTVLYRAAESLCLLMAPILPFTAEEVWRELPGREGRTGSVHLALLPERLPLAVDGDFRERWKRLLSIREKVTAAIEIERQAKRIGQALEAVVTIRASGEPLLFLRRYAGEIGSLFIVSKVVLEEGSSAEPEITVSRAPGVKCARCWHTLEDVGRDPENPTLCGRCAPIVRRLGEIRGS